MGAGGRPYGDFVELAIGLRRDVTAPVGDSRGHDDEITGTFGIRFSATSNSGDGVRAAVRANVSLCAIEPRGGGTYYLLSYVSTNARSDAKSRKTEIKVNRTGVQL